MVLWTHSFENRATGWLNDAFHHHFREVLLHTCHRFALANPCYVLMPDHWHLVWMGLSESSDQWLATAHLRKHLRGGLVPAQLQDRAHDHVLRENERAHGAFAAACTYVIQNPQRKGLCGNSADWPYLGAMVPGYPDLDPRTKDFWERFWKIYNRLIGVTTTHVREATISTERVPALTRRATSDGNIRVARCVSSGTSQEGGSP